MVSLLCLLVWLFIVFCLVGFLFLCFLGVPDIFSFVGLVTGLCSFGSLPLLARLDRSLSLFVRLGPYLYSFGRVPIVIRSVGSLSLFGRMCLSRY